MATNEELKQKAIELEELFKLEATEPKSMGHWITLESRLREEARPIIQRFLELLDGG